MISLDEFLRIVKELQESESNPKFNSKILIKKKLTKILNYSIGELLVVTTKKRWNNQAYQMARCNKDIVDLLLKKFQHLC